MDVMLGGSYSWLILLTVAIAAVFHFLVQKASRGPGGKPSSAQADFPPGPEASDPNMGNLGDVGAAGSLHQYLMKLHSQYGDIVSFWWMKDHVVSIASPETFKATLKLYNRPISLFALFMPLIGEKSIQYANDEDIKQRRRTYVDAAFSHNAIKQVFWCFNKVGKQFVDDLNAKIDSNENPIDLHSEMLSIALKSIVLTSLGGNFLDNEKVTAIRTAYDTCWHEMEQRMTGSFPEPDSERERAFQDALAFMHNTAKSVAKAKGNRQKPDTAVDKFCFLDSLVAAGIDEALILDEVVTFLVGGFHTTGNLLTWVFYYIAKDPSIQDKMRQEMQSVLGEDSDGIPRLEQVAKFKYTNQVVKEALRCSVLAPWAARYSNEECRIGDYTLPAKTPVIQALGVQLYDPKYFPHPERFDPDRFSDEAKRIPTLAFSPFGFAGKRVCPGNRYAYYESTVFLAAVLCNFRVSLPDGFTATPVHGLVTSPAEKVPLRVERL